MMAELFKQTQSAKIPAKTEMTIYKVDIPQGYAGYLYSLASSCPNSSLYIDDTYVPEVIGSLNSPSSFSPPYLVTKNMQVKAYNDTDAEGFIIVSCKGELYQGMGVAQVLAPAESATEKLLAQIKDELTEIKKNAKPKPEELDAFEIVDDFITVTDQVYLLYDDAEQGLKWSSCSLINKGPGDVYFSVNSWKKPNAPLAIGEAAHIDLGVEEAIKRIYFICDTGKNTQVKINALK